MKHYNRWKFTILLACMFLLAGVRIALHGTSIATLATDLLGAVVVVAGVLAACTHKQTRMAAILFALPPLLLTVVAQVDTPLMEPTTFALLRATSALFLGFMTLTIMAELLNQRDITRDSLAGAFCGYLLIGLAWSDLFSWIDLVSPGAFSHPELEHFQQMHEGRTRILHYFSFVTLSTVGYGDVVAISPVARILACLEAICGQFYLAVLVAGLVSIRVGQLASNQKPTHER